MSFDDMEVPLYRLMSSFLSFLIGWHLAVKSFVGLFCSFTYLSLGVIRNICLAQILAIKNRKEGPSKNLNGKKNLADCQPQLIGT